MIALHHPEQVLRRIVLMREDENPLTPGMRRPMVKPAAYVCRAALLPPFQDQRPDAAD
jgi:hypothetical protein